MKFHDVVVVLATRWTDQQCNIIATLKKSGAELVMIDIDLSLNNFWPNLFQ